MIIVENKYIQEISKMRGVIAKTYNISGIILTALYALTQPIKQML